jgi:ribosomal protein L13
MIVITQNNSNILEIDKELFEEVKDFLRNLSKKKKKSFSYTDDIGDLVVVINGEEYVVPTKSDIEAILKSKKNDFLDEDEAKRLLDV